MIVEERDKELLQCYNQRQYWRKTVFGPILNSEIGANIVLRGTLKRIAKIASSATQASLKDKATLPKFPMMQFPSRAASPNPDDRKSCPLS